MSGTFQAALGGMIAAAGVGSVMVGRTWPTPSGTRRARQVSDTSLLDDLLGPDSYWTTIPEHAPAPIKAALGECPVCDRVTTGSLNEDGWLCGECLQPVNTTVGGVR